MSGSKPEELVAKLYEEGMTDDEVKAQLSDFGLSGREIHTLMKKAQSIIADASKKKPKAPPQPLFEPPEREETRGITDYTNIVKSGSNRAIESSSYDAESELINKPIEELGTGGLDRFWSKKAGTEEPSDEIEGLKGLLPREPPAAAKKGEAPGAEKEGGEKKSFFGLFGKKGAGQKEVKGQQTAPPSDQKLADQKLQRLMGQAGGFPQSPLPASQKPKLLMGQAGNQPKSPFLPDGAKKDAGKKDDKKGGKKGSAKDENYQIKMKRLLLIKEAISQPIAEPAASDFAKMDLEGPPPKEEPAPVMEPEPPMPAAKAAAKQREFPRLSDEILLTTNEDEEKMDQELANKLLGNMKNMETEMGEIRQLLETLRELNIKLIEILESGR